METKIVQERQKKLSGNFRRMFFIQAFQNIRTINVVVVIFYLARGLSLTEVFNLAIVWSVVNILFEVPSSYLADKWSRNKTIRLGVALYLVSCLLLIVAHSFFAFGLSIFFYALSNACFTGTDEALIYDTNRELGKHGDSLRRLGQYYSAERVFKILSPLVGAYLAKDLVDYQFILLMSIDSVCALLALIISFFIFEPKHHFEVEKVEAGIFRDAAKLIKNNPSLIRLICNRSLAFIGIFIIWRYHQELFISAGTSILALGFGWSLFHFIVFVLNYSIHKFWPSKSLSNKINFLNFLTVIFIGLFIIGWYFKIHYYWLLAIYLVFNITENIRWPIFSDLVNRYSNSFNRATTLSLSNLIKSILEIPLLFSAGIFITYGFVYPLYISLALVSFASVVLYLPKEIKFENKC